MLVAVEFGLLFQLMLWLNAEMLVNALFVLHLFMGWYTIDAFQKDDRRWLKGGSLFIMGLLAGWTVCAKEQGILLLPVSILLMSTLTIRGQAAWIRQVLQRLREYGAGVMAPLAWYGVHFREQWTNGEKWRIFIDDLRIMFSQDSLSDQLNAPTTWGTFSARFGHSDSWWGFFQSSSSLLQEFPDTHRGCLERLLWNLIDWTRSGIDFIETPIHLGVLIGKVAYGCLVIYCRYCPCCWFLFLSPTTIR